MTMRAVTEDGRSLRSVETAVRIAEKIEAMMRMSVNASQTVRSRVALQPSKNELQHHWQVALIKIVLW